MVIPVVKLFKLIRIGVKWLLAFLKRRLHEKKHDLTKISNSATEGVGGGVCFRSGTI